MSGGAPLQCSALFNADQTIEIVGGLVVDADTPFPWADYRFEYTVDRGSVLKAVQGDDQLAVDPDVGQVAISIAPGRICPGEHEHELNAVHIESGKVLPIFDGPLVVAGESGR